MSDHEAEAPPIIERVKSTRYSVARIYGRVVVGGQVYIYRRHNDTLIRLDVFQEQQEQERLARGRRALVKN